MTTLYRVADKHGMPVGVFESLEDAKQIVPEVTQWRLSGEHKWNGWRPDGTFGGLPDFVIERSED